MVVQRKIIRKVNDNDDGRVVMRGADGNGGSIRLRFDRIVLSVERYVSPALGRAVLNDYAGAVRRSVAGSLGRY